VSGSRQKVFCAILRARGEYLFQEDRESREAASAVFVARGIESLVTNQ